MEDVKRGPRRALALDEDASWSSSAARRWASPDAEEPSQVAPPVPVLPVGHSSAGLGRRFSADELPDDIARPDPRRSATSPGSDPFDEVESLSTPGGATAVLGGATASAPGSASRHHFTVRWFWPVVAVAVVAALVLAWSILNKPAPAVVPGGTATARATMLADPADLTGLRAATTWTATTDLAPDETKGIRCVSPSAQLKTPPLTASVLRRTLTATTGDPASVVQQVETYADAATAEGAYAIRVSELGGCPSTPDLVNEAYSATGLGDAATGVLVTELDAATLVHNVLVVRTGSTLSIVDATAGATPISALPLASALVPSLQRLCGPAGGTCPSTPSTTTIPVPAGDPAGFLTSGDLPRVTPGVGTWVGAEMRPMKLAGSGCEDVTLTAAPDSGSATQRSYLLTGDSAASDHFGLDEIVYTFSTAEQAKAFADSLIANVTDCAKKHNTATVTPLGKLSGDATGQLFTVDQRQTLTKAARSRVLIAQLGTHVVYIIGNPTAEFDLAEAAWLSVGQRAAERTRQLA